MRLVSAIYDDLYPFDTLWPMADTFCTSDPDDLRVGDVLVVWGGADIHPSLYQHGRSSMSYASQHGPSQRDEVEWGLMRTAKLLGCPIIGVCRGAQMLCALAGGSLVQHVNGHGGSNHLVRTHDDHHIQVNSIHHQMMNAEGTNHTVVAATIAPLSNIYNLMQGGQEKNLKDLFSEEPEFIDFHDVRGFAIQWHPEMMAADSEATQYVHRYISQKIAT